MKRPNLFGPADDAQPPGHTGGLLPSLRTHYPLAVREALAALAEQRPPWPLYLRERERILKGAQGG